MAIFSNLVITTQGKSALVALATGTGEKLTFTRVPASGKEYEIGNLESLTELENICQSAEVSSVNIGENGTVVIEAAFENKALSNGYFMRTLGLCAKTDGEEFLFAVAVEQSGRCYMPPFNGKTLGGMLVSLAVAVSNTENITVEAGSAAVATVNDIKRLQNALAEHNTSPEAHSGLQKELLRIDFEVSMLKLKYDTKITANEFSVTFETVDGLSVDGVYNTARGRIDF